MFSVQRKKEALGRGTIKLLPRNHLNSICEHVSFRNGSTNIMFLRSKMGQLKCISLGYPERGNCVTLRLVYRKDSVWCTCCLYEYFACTYFAVWRKDQRRRNGCVCLKGRAWDVLASCMLCLLHMQRTARGFDLLLPRRKDPLWKTPRWAAQTTLLSLRWGKATRLKYSEETEHLYISPDWSQKGSWWVCIPVCRLFLLMSAQRPRDVTGTWSTSPVLNARQFWEDNATSWRMAGLTAVAVLNHFMPSIVRLVETT